MYLSWKLRGGICKASHVRECFKWLERYDCEKFLSHLVGLSDQSVDASCILSELDEEEKKELKCSWIIRWAQDQDKPKSVLVGKQCGVFAKNLHTA